MRCWRSKYPTSKVDDCAVVCLFLDSNETVRSTSKSKENIPSPETDPTVLNRSGTVRTGNEALESGDGEGPVAAAEGDQTENIEMGREWLALEGVSRVNTLLTLPRYLPGKEDKKETKAKK